MNPGIVKAREHFPHRLWQSLDPLVKWRLVLAGQVVFVNGRPEVSGEMPARVLADLEAAIADCRAEEAQAAE